MQQLCWCMQLDNREKKNKFCVFLPNKHRKSLTLIALLSIINERLWIRNLSKRGSQLRILSWKGVIYVYMAINGGKRWQQELDKRWSLNAQSANKEIIILWKIKETIQIGLNWWSIVNFATRRLSTRRQSRITRYMEKNYVK